MRHGRDTVAYTMTNLWGEYDALAEEAVRLQMALEQIERKRADLRKRLGSTQRRVPKEGRSVDAQTEVDGVLAEIVEGVRSLGGKTKAKQIAQALGIAGPLARARLQRAAREGLLCRVDRGVYALPKET